MGDFQNRFIGRLWLDIVDGSERGMAYFGLLASNAAKEEKHGEEDDAG